MAVGIINHTFGNQTFLQDLQIFGKLTNAGNRIYVAAGDSVIEGNAVGTADPIGGFITYTGANDVDRFHISRILKSIHNGATMKITNIIVYTDEINNPDELQSVKIRHCDLTDGSGTLTTDWEDPTVYDSGKTHPYDDVNVTIIEGYTYYLEITLKANTNNIDITGFLIQFDFI